MNKRDYILHLIGEMSHFILDGDPNRMVISLHQEEDGMHLAILDDKKRTEAELEDIRHAINCSRRPELAGYYGTMAGQEMLGTARLNLIGWQIKHGDVNRSDSGTKIDLWLGGDRFNPTDFSIPDEES